MHTHNNHCICAVSSSQVVQSLYTGKLLSLTCQRGHQGKQTKKACEPLRLQLSKKQKYVLQDQLTLLLQDGSHPHCYGALHLCILITGQIHVHTVCCLSLRDAFLKVLVIIQHWPLRIIKRVCSLKKFKNSPSWAVGRI
jgi:hypothetical protein